MEELVSRSWAYVDGGMINVIQMTLYEKQNKEHVEVWNCGRQCLSKRAVELIFKTQNPREIANHEFYLIRKFHGND